MPALRRLLVPLLALAQLGAIPPEPPEVPSRLQDPPLPRARSLSRSEDLLGAARRNADGRYVVQVDGRARVLTLDPGLQEKLTAIMASYQTPWAAVAVVEPSTGRVLALAEHSEIDPAFRGLPVKAAFPAASIFKVVTAGALLEAGVKPSDEACSFGGFRSVVAQHLEDTPRDRECFSLGQALGVSANAVFAKLTVKHLTSRALLDTAGRFGFNQSFDFPLPLEPSLAAIPGDRMGLGEAGAGFGDVFLSPLHGALLAAVPATGGLLPAPRLFEDDASPEPSRVLDAGHAALLGQMLEETVTRGTARRVFSERGHRVPGAAGKTGSLADKRPFRDYSWFVGYAPKDAPRIAVAAVVVNDPHWRIRATWLGREALRHGLAASAAVTAAPR
jgi:peptidoglycan glycosyltransferase